MSDAPPPPPAAPSDPPPPPYAAVPPPPPTQPVTQTLPPVPPPSAPVGTKPGGFALAALIVGGVAFLFGLVPYFGVLVAITGIVFAILALVRKQNPRWMPLVGGGAAVLALLTGLIVTSVVAGGLRTPVAAPPAPKPTQEQVEETSEPEPQPEETQAVPAAPQLTIGQEQAVRKAVEYLAFTSFSRTGLIAQLEYEGFDTADATFAVDSITVDWNEQAALKAQEYLEFTSFSKESLTEQLLYEGFTQAEADYGVAAVGF